MNLEVITVNFWQIIISLCNLGIIFLIVKRFLFKPVVSTLEKRRADIEADYASADAAKREALASYEEYSLKLSHAKADADEIIREAETLAKRRGDELIISARGTANDIVKRAKEQAVLEKARSEAMIKKEITEASVMVAEKLIKKRLDAKAHGALIDSFINELGDV